MPLSLIVTLPSALTVNAPGVVVDLSATTLIIPPVGTVPVG